MTGMVATVALSLATAATGGLFSGGTVVRRVPASGPQVAAPGHAHGHGHHHHNGHGWVLPPGPGLGWGFPNGAADGYGYMDNGVLLPLGGDRNPDYFFPRYFSALPEQMFLQSYYNPYVTRGQRYIPYVGCGGAHPFGGPPQDNIATPVYPDREAENDGPVVEVPDFTGEVEAPPSSSFNGGAGGTPGLYP